MSEYGNNLEGSRRRGKPAVAFQSQQAARKNIQAKLAVLVRYVEKRSHTEEPGTSRLPENFLSLDQLPQSVRQFNAWTSSTFPAEIAKRLSPFHSNANDTLRLHEDLHSSVVQAIARFKNLKLLSSQKKGKLENMASLRRRLTDAQVISDIAKREIKVVLEELEATKRQLVETRCAREALEREVAAALLSAQNQIAELRERNAELTKSFAKISKLKRP